MKKERRRLQEQLRRIKRNQERDVTSPKLTKKQRKELFKHVRAAPSSRFCVLLLSCLLSDELCTFTKSSNTHLVALNDVNAQ